MEDDDNNNTPPPPPPPPQQDAFTPQEMFDSRPDPYEQKLDSGRPEVASNPTRVFIVLGGMGIILMYLLYSIFFSGKDKQTNEDVTTRAIATDTGDKGELAPPPPLGT